MTIKFCSPELESKKMTIEVDIIVNKLCSQLKHSRCFVSNREQKVEKRLIKSNELLSTWETIAKAAEAEKICAAKMSRSIKNKTIFKDDYYFCVSMC